MIQAGNGYYYSNCLIYILRLIFGYFYFHLCVGTVAGYDICISSINTCQMSVSVFWPARNRESRYSRKWQWVYTSGKENLTSKDICTGK